MIAENQRPTAKLRGDRVSIVAACAADYRDAGRLFEESKIVLAQRGEITKAIVAYRTFPKTFYVHHFWAESGETDDYDAGAVKSLTIWLRQESTRLGYDGVNYQIMSEQMPLAAFLQVHCKAVPVALFGFMPPIVG